MRYLLITVSMLVVFFSLTSSTTKTVSRSLELVIVDSKPLIVGELNGKAAAFLIDTGSDLSILCTKSAKRFQYLIKDGKNINQKIAGVGGISSRIGEAYQVDLRLGDEAIKTRFRSCDLSHLTAEFPIIKGVKMVGIIGADVLLKYGFVIDYEEEMAVFDPTTSPQPKHENVSGQFAIE